MPFIIVDLDGSLSNDSHRQAKRPTHSKNNEDWDAYHSLLHLDPVNWFIRDMIIDFGRRYPDSQVVLLTGRCAEQTRAATESWLAIAGVRYDELIMKSKLDIEMRNSEFKRMAFQNYLLRTKQHYSDCMLAIEDLPEIIDLWKSYGIPVLQVHQKEIVL